MLHFYGIKEAIEGAKNEEKDSPCMLTMWVKELFNNEQKGYRTYGIKKVL